LVIKVIRKIKINIGKLDEVVFNKGTYIYVGSGKGEFGGSELINRVLRHIRQNKKIRWHIDYLLNSHFTRIKNIGLIFSNVISECDLIRKIIDLFVTEPISNFGSTDCINNCPSHLVKIA
jgi:Uri superfamily endonuclease